MARHRDRRVLSGGGIVERSLVVPSGSLVERTGSCVAGHDCEPGLGVSVRSDLPLCLTHQDRGDASSSMESRDVDLFDFVVDDHDEASDGTVDDGDCCVADAFQRPCPERVFGPDLDQLLWDESKMAILPTEMPDVRDSYRILLSGAAKRHSQTARDHPTDPSGTCPDTVSTDDAEAPDEFHFGAASIQW